MQAARERKIVELVHAEELTGAVRSLVFRRKDGQPFEYIAGQWVNLHLVLPSGPVTRAYSIARAPGFTERGDFEVAVTKVTGGAASSFLHEMPLRSEVEIDGPWGFFTRDQAPDVPTLFVGTGTGLSPLRAMIHAEFGSRLGAPGHGPERGKQRVVLLFGCRTESDVLYRSEFEALASQNPRFVYEVTLSRANATWARHGYVQEHLPDLVAKHAIRDVYICGLSDMVEGVRRTLKEQLGFERKQIHSERYD